MRPELLARAMSISRELALVWFAPISNAMGEFAIDRDARQADFLAQFGHETEGLTRLREIWGPTADQARYGTRSDLGITRPEAIAIAAAAGVPVGRFFSGVGGFMDTGYDNILKSSMFIFGDDRAAHDPRLLMEPNAAARAAGHYWDRHKLNAFADAGDFEGETRKINGGTNGLPDRQRRRAIAMAALA